jgi:hypothetical protein
LKIKLFYIILIGGSLCGCKVTFHPPTEAQGFNIDPNTKSIVLIDCGITTTTGIAIKKKREGVVKEFKNQYLVSLSKVLQDHLHLEIITDTTLSVEEKNKLLQKDSIAITTICSRYKNGIVLILKDCYSGFNQDVRKVESWDGKSTSKVATYSVFFDTGWIIVQGNSVNEKNVSASKFHSTRNVLSGLLARGPGFAANKNDILEMANQNALNVAMLFKY